MSEKIILDKGTLVKNNFTSREYRICESLKNGKSIGIAQQTLEMNDLFGQWVVYRDEAYKHLTEKNYIGLYVGNSIALIGQFEDWVITAIVARGSILIATQTVFIDYDNDICPHSKNKQWSIVSP